MAERPLRCGSETSSLQRTQAFICSAGEGFAGAGGGRLFTHGINRQPTVGMRKSARASLLPSSGAVDSVALGPACTPAAGGRSGIERRPRGHMKESFKDSSHRTIEGRLPFLCVPSCFLLVFGFFFSIRPGVWRHFLSAVPALPLCVFICRVYLLLRVPSPKKRSCRRLLCCEMETAGG
ncbi:hypothetical protein QQF64_002873 [Cirrhinus molitorella]|uniref:Transmembrane protein n=1 Tax=Cirrhinus molitorella TaxID=172907 RepID=A0ABR3MRC4_9TELE